MDVDSEIKRVHIYSDLTPCFKEIMERRISIQKTHGADVFQYLNTSN